MKAKDVPTKDQKRRLNQAVYQDCLDAMSTNLAMYCVILHEVFGFGEKRLRLFLSFTLKFVKWFKDFDDDGLANEKLIERLEVTGIKWSEISGKEDMYEYAREQKTAKKKAVSLKEASQMKKELEVMQALVNGGGTHGL